MDSPDTCPTCDAPAQPGDAYCAACGAPLRPDEAAAWNWPAPPANGVADPADGEDFVPLGLPAQLEPAPPGGLRRLAGALTLGRLRHG